MLGIHDFWLFVLSGLLLNITPGPDTIYIIGRAVQTGWRGGAVAALGISAGCLMHVFGAAIGLSALLATSVAAFTAVKLIGAAYLLYMGVRMIVMQTGVRAEAGASPELTLRQIFWQGVLTNALNPKVALFFLAFLPQFVDAQAPGKAIALIALGTVFIVNGTLWNLGMAAFSARAAGQQPSQRLLLWMNRALGGMFVALGLRMATLAR